VVSNIHHFARTERYLIVEADHPPKYLMSDIKYFGESPATELLIFQGAGKINRFIDF